MTVSEIKNHALRFSKSYLNGQGIWKEDFNAMAIKTVLKLLLAKYAPLSIEMQRAVITDQALINNEDATDISYPDNESTNNIDKQAERLQLMLNDCKTLDEVEALQLQFPDNDIDLFNKRKAEIANENFIKSKK